MGENTFVHNQIGANTLTARRPITGAFPMNSTCGFLIYFEIWFHTNVIELSTMHSCSPVTARSRRTNSQPPRLCICVGLQAGCFAIRPLNRLHDSVLRWRRVRSRFGWSWSPSASACSFFNTFFPPTPNVLLCTPAARRLHINIYTLI